MSPSADKKARRVKPKSSTGNNAPAAMPQIQMPLSAIVGGGYGLGGYQGAQWSRNRGFIYWPTLDPALEQDSFSRVEMARRIHFLKANVGLPRRILTGLTNLIVGAGLWPQALTKDREWNRKATSYYFNRAKSPITYDVTGKFAAGEFQRMAVRGKLGDGDAAVVYAYSQTGRLMRKLYSGLQIGNAGIGTMGGMDQTQWIDGVFRDSLERPALYRFLTQGGGRSRDIDAQKMAFLARYPEPGSLRGESVLSHAVNKLIDLTEIRSSWVNLIKNSSSIGYYLAAGNTQAGTSSMPQEVLKKTFGDRLKKTEEGVGADKKKVTLKVVMGNGDEIVELPPGYDIKTLLDQRPHPNQMEFNDEIIRDICHGAGMSFDLIWKIYKLGGANTRYVMADAQVFAETEQDNLIFTWLMRDYAQTIAAGITAGDLPACEDPEWWNHGWLPPARMTVDYGRDGRIILEEYARGLVTTERYFALKGQDAKEEFIVECDFAEFRREEMERRNLTEADFAYLRAGAAGLTQVQPAADAGGDNGDGEGNQQDNGNQSDNQD